VGLAFVTTRYLFRDFGADILGLIFFAQTFGVILNQTLDLGISNTVVKLVSSTKEADRDRVEALLRVGSLYMWTCWFVLGVTAWFAAPFIVSHWLKLSSLAPADAVLPVRILCFAILLGLPRALYASYFRGLQRREIPNLIEILSFAAQQAGILVLLQFTKSLPAVAGWILVTSAFATLAYLVMCARFLSPRALLPGTKWQLLTSYKRFALGAAGLSVQGVIVAQTDKLLLSTWLPTAAYGLYMFAVALTTRIAYVNQSIGNAAFPSLCEALRENDNAELVSRYRRLHDLMSYGLIPICSLIPFGAPFVFRYVFNPEAAAQLFVPATLLAVGTYMNGTLIIPSMLMMARERLDIAIRQNIVALFIVTPCTVFLVAKWGMIGAALSWIGFQVFAYAYGIPRCSRECLQMPARDWFKHIARPYALACLTYLPAWLLAARLPGEPVVQALIAYLVASILFAALSWGGLEITLRSSILRVLRLQPNHV
jgi:O-antigen/teichoic acid export membrane protein